MKYLPLLLLLLAGIGFAENTIPNYGFYENPNEITAKDRIIPGVSTIKDYDTDAQDGRYYVPITYRGGNNGADTDFVYLDEIAGKDGATGAVGSTGSTGLAGSKGDKGAQGTTGDQGANGRDGRDASINNNLFLNIGASVRWYDWKHFALHSGYRYDLNHYNHTVDVAVIEIKLFKSYEQRESDKLQKRVELLERLLRK